MEWVKLGDIAEIVSGSTPKTGEKRFWGGNLPWITPAELIEGKKFIYSTERQITELGVKAANLKIIPENSILLTSRAPIGKVAINKIPLYTNQGFKSIVPDPNKLDVEYMYFWIRQYNDFLQHLGNGATFKEISKKVIEGINFLLPNLETQKSIVNKLSHLETLIAKRQEQIDALDALVESLFLEISEQVEGALVQFKTVASIETNTVDDFASFSDEYYLGVEDIEKKTGKILKQVKVRDTKIKSSKNRFTRGTILYSKIRPNLNKVALPDFDGLVSTDVFPIKCGDKINKYYLLHELRSEKFVLYATLNSSGANIPRVNRKKVEDYTFKLPPITLQNRFADYVTSIEAQKESLRTSLAELETLFDALMQEAFSGHLNQS